MISLFTETTVNTGWIAMWSIAILLFGIAKLAVAGARPNAVPFVLFWPGMDLRAFNRTGRQMPTLVRRGLLNLTAGAITTWLLARHLPGQTLAVWCCMIGFIIALHGGVFTLLTAFWRARGHDVAPLMNCPIAAASITEFWGKRWNTGFRDLAHRFLFMPAARRWGPVAGMWASFIGSGLIHELVITVPAHGSYGGPTLYFAMQAVGVSLERGCPIKRTSLFWRFRALTFLIVPLPLCFPQVFIERVAAPFFTFIHALP